MDKNLIKTYTVKGLKVALVHHLDMPIMRQTGFHISPGTENQIAITPTLLATTRVSNRDEFGLEFSGSSEPEL